MAADAERDGRMGRGRNGYLIRAKFAGDVEWKLNAFVFELNIQILVYHVSMELSCISRYSLLCTLGGNSSSLRQQSRDAMQCAALFPEHNIAGVYHALV